MKRGTRTTDQDQRETQHAEPACIASTFQQSRPQKTIGLHAHLAHEADNLNLRYHDWAKTAIAAHDWAFSETRVSECDASTCPEAVQDKCTVLLPRGHAKSMGDYGPAGTGREARV